MTKYRVFFRTPIPMPKDKQPDCADVLCEFDPEQIKPEIVNVMIEGIRFHVPMSNVIAIQYIPESPEISDLGKRIAEELSCLKVSPI